MKEKKEKRKSGPTGSWFQMPRELTLSSELDPYQYRVLSILLERDGYHQSTKEKDCFWCHLDWITQHSGMGKTKVKGTIKELADIGFISIASGKNRRQANWFRVNWDNINAYKRPLTKQELDDEVVPVFQEKEFDVPAATIVPSFEIPPVEDQEDGFVATQTEPEPESDYDEVPDEPKDWDMPQQPQTIEEWYQSTGEATLFERFFPKLLLYQRAKNDYSFEEGINAMTDWLEEELPGCDMHDVIDNYVGPGWNRFKKQIRETKQMNNNSKGITMTPPVGCDVSPLTSDE